MKTKTILITGLTAALALSSTAFAEKDAKKEASKMKNALEWFDADGDGTLDDTEKATMKSTLAARQARAIASFDTDGDGKLNDSERATATAAAMAKRDEIKTALLAKFDADADGTLNKEEKSSAKEWARANYADEIPFPLSRKGGRKGPKGGKKGPKAE